MHRLEAVAHIGECAAHDHAHGVVEIRPAHLVFDINGHYIAAISVTAKRQLEEDLKTVRKRLEDALEHMADGLVLFDAEGVIQLSNRQYPRLFPLTADLRVVAYGFSLSAEVLDIRQDEGAADKSNGLGTRTLVSAFSARGGYGMVADTLPL